MEPADPLPTKLTLEDTEFKKEQVMLTHHSMLTPMSMNFSVLRSPTQNFKYRGVLWLTDSHLIYKGFPIIKMGSNKVSENLVKPFCELDTKQPFETIVKIENISDVFVGHDDTFQKRFQRYPKLRIKYKGVDGEITSYFYLTRENLIDDELYINKRCTEWHDKINDLLSKTVGAEPAAATAAEGAPKAAAVKAVRVGTDGLLKEAVAGVEKKIVGKVIVKPLEEREKPQFSAIAMPIDEAAPVEEDAAFAKLLDGLVPVSDEEFNAAAADTSISKCPHCGWILGYATNKCPRCRKEL